MAAPSAAAYYGPRFDYDPITKAPKGLLIEEQRTNLLTYSEQFDNAAWVKTTAGDTITANAVVAPDGTTTADKLTPDTTSTGGHRIYQSVSTSSTSTLSFYAKAAGYSHAFVTASGVNWVYFDLSAGTVESSLGTGWTAATITDAGNGWYRCTATTSTANTAYYIGVYNAAATNGNSAPTFAGNGTSGIYVWGAQLEAGAFATSYIPTVASQVTRAADTAIMQGANFSNWYNVNAGTAYAEFDHVAAPLGTGNKGIYAFYLNGSNNIVSYSANSGGALADVVVSGGVVQAGLTSVSVLAANTVYKDAQAYAQDSFARSLNGATVQTDSSGSVPTGLNVLRLGWDDTASPTLNGHLRRFAYYNRRLSNSELQGITA